MKYLCIRCLAVALIIAGNPGLAQEKVPVFDGKLLDAIREAMQPANQMYIPQEIMPRPVPTRPEIGEQRPYSVCTLSAELTTEMQVLRQNILAGLENYPDHLLAFADNTPQDCDLFVLQYYRKVALELGVM